MRRECAGLYLGAQLLDIVEPDRVVRDIEVALATQLGEGARQGFRSNRQA